MSLRVAFIGCVEFSRAALSLLLRLPEVTVVGVVTRRESAVNADFQCLADVAEVAGCPVHFAQGNDQMAMEAFLRGLAADVIYCFGWSYLLRPGVLTAAPQGVIGYHPAALPANRGRHPIVWALALGLSETASTFFRMGEGADDGDIVDQRPVPIRDDDDAASLYARLIHTGLEQIAVFTAALAAGRPTTRPQDHDRANTWRKRGRKDGEIDWRMAPKAIYDLVRALTRPYVGAHIALAEGDAKVWRCAIGPEAPANLEPGRVLAVDGRKVTVKCWQGSLVLIDHELPVIPTVGTCL